MTTTSYSSLSTYTFLSGPISSSGPTATSITVLGNAGACLIVRGCVTPCPLVFITTGECRLALCRLGAWVILVCVRATTVIGAVFRVICSCLTVGKGVRIRFSLSSPSTVSCKTIIRSWAPVFPVPTSQYHLAAPIIFVLSNTFPFHRTPFWPSNLLTFINIYFSSQYLVFKGVISFRPIWVRVCFTGWRVYSIVRIVSIRGHESISSGNRFSAEIGLVLFAWYQYPYSYDRTWNYSANWFVFQKIFVPKVRYFVLIVFFISSLVYQLN